MDDDYEARRELALQRLRTLVARPEVRAALAVASPGLCTRLDAWLEHSGQDGIELAVARYLARMSLRCTPFGLFAGVGVGSIGSGTDLTLGPRSSNRRHSRLDMGYLSRLVERIVSMPEVRRELRFHPNSSVFPLGERLHYFEAREGSRGRQYYLVAVDDDESLRATLRRAEGGATLAELAELLVDDEITLEDASEYVDELVAAQLLVSELEPAVTGKSPFLDLLAQLQALPAASGTLSALQQIREELDRIDGAGLAFGEAMSEGLSKRLQELNPEANASQLLQIDLTKPREGMRLDPAIVETVQRALGALQVLFGSSTGDGLDDFRKAFRDRYGEAERPLAEVLDEEIGIGFRASRSPAAEAQPLLRGLDVIPLSPESRGSPSPVDGFLLQKLCDALASGSQEIEITEEEVASLRSPQVDVLPLPDALSVMACLWPSRDGFEVAISGGGGPSGARLLGRFTPLDDRLEQLVREHVKAEEALHPERVYFEIVHLPEGRLGNVLCRTVLRDNELSFLGRSGADAERQFTLGDLMISLQEDRIVLRSRRLDCEVVPRLTSAHNAARRSVGIYRFLAALQQQGVRTGVSWNWGNFQHAPFLPRVRYGKAVLAPRRWNVRAKELVALRDADPATRFEQFGAWARRRGLPRCFALTDGDRSLPVDVENPLSFECFWDLVAKRSGFLLEELLPPPDACAVTGPEGGYANEIVLPFVRPAPPASTARRRRRSLPSTRRPIGSEWSYAKIYCGKAAADALLVEQLAPLQRECSQWVDHWFFIRYSDPHFHLRLRAHGDPELLLREYHPRLLRCLAPFQQRDLIWQVQFDEYEQEVDRYGGPQAMALCEQIFAADSEATIDCLARLRGAGSDSMRWRLTLRGLDALADDFDLDDLRRQLHYDRLSNGFRREFEGEQRLKKQVLQRYREQRPQVEQALSRNGSLDDALRTGVEIFARRSERIRPIVAQLREFENSARLWRPLDDILSSLMHMHANRMTRSAARAQEMVLYSMLAAHYDSALARQGIKGATRRALIADLAKELRGTAG